MKAEPNTDVRELLDVSRAFLAYQVNALIPVGSHDRYAFVAGWEAAVRALTDAGLLTFRQP